MAYIIQSSLLVVLLMVLGSYGQDNAGARLAVGDADEQRIPYHPCRYSWGRWGQWTPCTATCGKGYQVRRRQCYKRCPFLAASDELVAADRTDQLRRVSAQIPLGTVVSYRYCSPGSPIERRECWGAVNGSWSKWGCWGECKNGTRQRHRICNSPVPTGWGNYCVGDHTETGDCGCLAGQDVIFVIDRSGSIGRTNFDLMVSQVNSVIQLLDLDTGLGPLSKVRVGVELFNHGQLAFNHLNNFAVPTTPYPYNGGGTNIAAAITFAHQVMFTSTRGDRTPHNPNTMVVITDGQSASPIAAAQAAKADGIKIIAVGVGNNVNLSHLQGIVTDVSTDLYTTNNFCSIADYLRRRFDCNSNKFRAALTPFQCTGTVFRTSSDAGSDGGEEEARKSSA